MAYDTYKTVLDKYLTSGVKYLRYIHKSIGKATIYYPVINDAQIKSCLTDQTFKDGTKTYYDKSKPYSEWEWFNDRLSWFQSFHPSSAEEAVILCKMGKYSHPNRLTLDSENPNKATTVHQLKDLFDSTPDESLTDKLHEDGYYIVNDADRYYCIDFANKVILDMEHEGLDVSRLKKQQTQQEITPVQSVQPVQKPNIIQGIRKVLQQSGGSKDANREHEVGSHGNYDDIDDERHLKR